MIKNLGFLYNHLIWLLAILASCLILWVTPFGSGVSPDSTIYIEAAKNIFSGKGFYCENNPVTHFPPLFSLALVVIGLFQKDFIQSARLLNAALFGVNTALIVFAVHKIVGRNLIIAALSILFFLPSAVFIEIHSWAWSEPLFIALSLTCIITICLYCQQNRYSLLVVSAIYLGLAIMTRYVGIAFLPAALIIIYKANDHPIRERFRRTIIYAFLSLGFIGAFFFRNTLFAGSFTNRTLEFHPFSAITYIKLLISNLINYFAPVKLAFGVKPAIFGFFAAILVVVFVVIIKRNRRGKICLHFYTTYLFSSLLFSCSYVLFLFISICFLDANTPVDTRILSPIFAILTPSIFSIFWTVLQAFKKPIIFWAFIILMIFSIFLKSQEARGTIEYIRNEGLGYTSPRWVNSDIISFIKLQGKEKKIYSNGPDIITFLAERQAEFIPQKIFLTTNQVNTSYNDEIAVMCKGIKEDRAILVYFYDYDVRWYLPTQDELLSLCELQVQNTFLDGSIIGEWQ